MVNLAVEQFNSYPNPVTSPTTKEVISWLRSSQPAFTKALADFGLKTGWGFDQYSVGTSFRTFSGAGLCGLAVGAMEEAIGVKYGTSVLTEPYFLCTYRRDAAYSVRSLQDNTWPHWILRFSVENQWFFADPTFRQFCSSVNPEKMLIGLPVGVLERIYGSWKIYESLKKVDPEHVDKYLPRSKTANQMHQINIDDIEAGRIEGITVVDYLKLLRAFQ